MSTDSENVVGANCSVSKKESMPLWCGLSMRGVRSVHLEGGGDGGLIFAVVRRGQLSFMAAHACRGAQSCFPEAA